MAKKKTYEGTPPSDFVRQFPACKGLHVSFEIVTPQLAVEYLGLNTTNRSLKAKQVQKLCTSLEKDGPLFTGDAFFFFEDGTLGEGQHRCHAVVKTGISIPVIVIRGVPHRTGAVQGTATPRHVRDRIQQRCQAEGINIRNISDKSAMPAHILRLQNMEAGMPWSRARWVSKPYTNNELADFVVEHDKRLTLALSMISHADGRILFTPRGGMAALAYHMIGIHKAGAKAFFDQICTGENLVKGDPILAFRRYLQKQASKAAKQQAKDDLHFKWAAGILAWNAYLEGATMQRIPAFFKVVKGEEQPIPWPMPKRPGNNRPWAV